MATAKCLQPYPVDIVDEPPLTIMFLGDDDIGKTTFISRYCQHILDNDGIEYSNGECFVFKQFVFHKERDGKNFAIRLLDLPKGTTMKSRKGQYPNKVDAIVLCFAVDNPNSLNSILPIWFREITLDAYRDRPRRLHLLGLKQDLRGNEEGRMNLVGEPVTLQRAFEVHQHNGFSGEYMEISAERDPEYAIIIMERLIEHVFSYRDHLPV